MSDELLAKLSNTLDCDLSHRLNKNNYNAADKTKRKSYQDFVKYLTSVATHPIGLRASACPFNSSQDHMLAYIMDMFALDDLGLRKILTRGKTESSRRIDDAKDQPPISEKRHSWRPELRVRMHPPRFYYQEQLYLDNIHVRVYIFKKVQRIEQLEQIEMTKVTPSKNVLKKIFDRLRPDLSILIRPVNEMRCMVKFERILKQHSSVYPNKQDLSSDYKMVQVTFDKEKVDGDVHLNIRRYYCELGSAHILRFEYWLNMDNINASILNQFRRLVRSIVYNGCRNQCRGGENRSTYMNERQKFYGFTNIDLTQLPSYATKQSYIIKNLNDKRVNHCEISIEPKNRRVADDLKVRVGEVNQDLRSKRDVYLRNHVRLYANCLLYHCLGTESKRTTNRKDDGFHQNITLDSLLYLPAHTLINQNRLQSSLNSYEDLCLRRIAILILLVKSEQQEQSSYENVSNILRVVKTKLLSVLKNEYSLVRRKFDDKTMQELYPFSDESAKLDIINLELMVLWSFVRDFILVRLQRWTMDTQDRLARMERTVTLIGLKALKTAIANFIKHLDQKLTTKENILQDLSDMQSTVEQALCVVIVTQIKSRLSSILGHDSVSILKERRRIQRFRRSSSAEVEIPDSWSKLLQSIRYVNHDLSLYWSQDALNGMIRREQSSVKRVGLFDIFERRNFRDILETKMDNYLK